MSWAQDKIRRLGGIGILTEDDIDELTDATAGVLALMLDHAWHDRHEIFKASGYQYEALRRMRELRDMGYTVERERSPVEKRSFIYRLGQDV